MRAVKPIDLCRWLVRLVTRPGHLVLDPYMGSGSVGCAAVLENRRFLGLDLDPDEEGWPAVARARIRHWEGVRDLPEPARETYTTDDPAQQDLFAAVEEAEEAA